MTGSGETEPFLDKVVRKFSQEPLVPVGAILTTAFLTSGFRAFVRGDAKRAQVLMRGRVLAQGFTVLAMCAGAYLGFKPPKQEHISEKLAPTPK